VAKLETSDMKRLPFAAIAFFTSAAWIVGCEGKSESGAAAGPVAQTSAALAASSVPSPTPAPSGAARDHRDGFAGMFFRAAQQIDLTDEQKAAVSTLEPLLHAAPNVRPALQTFHADLVAGIEAGLLDATKIQADLSAIDTAAQAARDAQGGAFGRLHDALDAPRRKALVDTLREKQAARDAGRKPFWAHDGGPANWTARRLDRMTQKLELDAVQQKQVAGLLAKDDVFSDGPGPRGMRDAGKTHLDALLTAFEAESFDAKSFDPSWPADKSPADRLHRQVTFLAHLLPILKPEQRDRLAALFAGPRGDSGRGGGGDPQADPFDGAD
jgi:Spy/CpxP family protein refolding chaperone